MNDCQTDFKQIKEFEIYSHFMQKRDEIKIFMIIVACQISFILSIQVKETRNIFSA